MQNERDKQNQKNEDSIEQTINFNVGFKPLNNLSKNKKSKFLQDQLHKISEVDSIQYKSI